MIFSTRRSDRPGAQPACTGFTLVELMVALSLSLVVIVAIFSAVLFITRSSINIGNYSLMESEVRSALARFGEDSRMAEDITASSTTSLTLKVPYLSGTQTVTYSYGVNPSDSRDECFLRSGYDPISGETSTVPLIHGVTNFTFNYFQLGGAAASSAASIKQVQLSLTALRNSVGVTTATNVVLSSRFILRNRKVSQ